MSIVVVGEDWQEITPHVVSILSAEDLNARLRAHVLEVWVNGAGWIVVSGVVWRTDIERGEPQWWAFLDLVEAAGVPTVNAPSCTRRFSGRLACMSFLSRAGFKTVEQVAVVGREALHQTQVLLPSVMKVGRWHSGLGKMIIRDEESFVDAADMAAISQDIVVIEPFLRVTTDIRVLVIGQTVVALSRCSNHWKASSDARVTLFTEVESALSAQASAAAAALGASVVGFDFLHLESGERVLLEANLCPGLLNEIVGVEQMGILHKAVIDLLQV